MYWLGTTNDGILTCWGVLNDSGQGKKKNISRTNLFGYEASEREPVIVTKPCGLTVEPVVNRGLVGDEEESTIIPVRILFILCELIETFAFPGSGLQWYNKPSKLQQIIVWERTLSPYGIPARIITEESRNSLLTIGSKFRGSVLRTCAERGHPYLGSFSVKSNLLIKPGSRNLVSSM